MLQFNAHLQYFSIALFMAVGLFKIVIYSKARAFKANAKSSRPKTENNNAKPKPRARPKKIGLKAKN